MSWRGRDDVIPWHTALPEIIFRADRSWLVSTSWDDDWSYVGARRAGRPLLADPDLEAREVQPWEDSTPPGHKLR